MSEKVIVGMSGGVDSSVSALLLKQGGYNVTGVFMKNWIETDDQGHCTSQKDFESAQKTCDILDIPLLTIEFAKEYQDKVFSSFLNDYKAGLTPNPDILCNKEIKFQVFYDKVKQLGAQYLATGHYCQTDGYSLLRGLDGNKDQSYFLCSINGQVLKDVLFPIGHLEKPEVRKLAESHKLPVWNRKDSTGICFIGERKFREFLSNYVQAQPGEFRTLDNKVVGTHHGSAFYTLGQRRGLGLGGPGPRWHVVSKNHENNIVYVERAHDHPLLFSSVLTCDQVCWISEEYSQKDNFTPTAKIRYRQEDQECHVMKNEDSLIVTFKQPQWAATVGQTIAFYDNQKCVGGARIRSTSALH